MYMATVLGATGSASAANANAVDSANAAGEAGTACTAGLVNAACWASWAGCLFTTSLADGGILVFHVGPDLLQCHFTWLQMVCPRLRIW